MSMIIKQLANYEESITYFYDYDFTIRIKHIYFNMSNLTFLDKNGKTIDLPKGIRLYINRGYQNKVYSHGFILYKQIEYILFNNDKIICLIINNNIILQ